MIEYKPLALDKAKAEFPHYDFSTLPPIPAGWTDDAWRNDLCPSFYAPAAKCVIWADYASAGIRDSGSPTRYSVCRQERDHHGANVGEPVEIYAGDDFAGGVLPVVLGEAFANTLVQWLTDIAYLEMRIRNREYDDPHICASHDFCDANMAMEEAFENLFGRESETSFETHYDAATGQHVADDPAAEARCDADVTLWNAAWGYAKGARLKASEAEAGLPDDVRKIWARLDEAYQTSTGCAFTAAEARALHLFMNLGKGG